MSHLSSQGAGHHHTQGTFSIKGGQRENRLGKYFYRVDDECLERVKDLQRRSFYKSDTAHTAGRIDVEGHELEVLNSLSDPHPATPLMSRAAYSLSAADAHADAFMALQMV